MGASNLFSVGFCRKNSDNEKLDHNFADFQIYISINVNGRDDAKSKTYWRQIN
jgi:hypothetical protein